MRTLILVLALFALPFMAQAQTSNNVSGVVVTGGSFQQIAPQANGRRSFEFQNICLKSSSCVANTDNCYVYFGPTSSASIAKAILVTPNSYYFRNTPPLPQEPIQVSCDGTGDFFYANLMQ